MINELPFKTIPPTSPPIDSPVLAESILLPVWSESEQVTKILSIRSENGVPTSFLDICQTLNITLL